MALCQTVLCSLQAHRLGNSVSITYHTDFYISSAHRHAFPCNQSGSLHIRKVQRASGKHVLEKQGQESTQEEAKTEVAQQLEQRIGNGPPTNRWGVSENAHQVVAVEVWTRGVCHPIMYSSVQIFKSQFALSFGEVYVGKHL